jgi:hypothetical protein
MSTESPTWYAANNNAGHGDVNNNHHHAGRGARGMHQSRRVYLPTGRSILPL